MPITVEKSVPSVQENQRPLTFLQQTGYLLAAMRPLHWVKNVFVLTALIFSRQLFQADSVLTVCFAFGIFCLISSAIYLANDICDREEDAKHPSKYMRPITCGLVSVKQALAFSIFLGAVALIMAFEMDTKFGGIASAYVAVNILYSIHLKKIVILDVLIIGVGFVFRVLAGFYCLSFDISNWVLICTFFLATLIAFSKRRYEIMFDGSSIQFTRGYSPYLLDLLILLSAGSVLSSYTFYVLSRGNWQIGIALLVSILPVFYGVIRYLLLIHRSEERLDHTQLILSDKPILLSVAIWVGLCIIEIYYIHAT